MKQLSILWLLLVSVNALANSSNSETLDTDEGFPYKNVIMRADRVELNYAMQDDKVECSIKVQSTELSKPYVGETQLVSKKQFRKTPMQACLTRPVAKALLAQL
ncbi:hypothetical protein ACFOEE_05410 [Pseudoalteromonas fenneropenaei]|uniref:Uncharacterized protein n=1 Tax=Pseudoalteromonas fenneropenaei TaxID=1737459 RepID=A0ABV7CH84_9GAMM